MKFLKNIVPNGMHAGMGVGGGAAARALVNKGLPMVPMVKDHPKLFNGIAFLAGVALMDFKKIHYVGVGMASVAGTDALAQFVPMLRAHDAAVSDDLAALADELADTLEDDLSDDVSNGYNALSEDVNKGNLADEMSEDVSEEVSGSDD